MNSLEATAQTRGDWDSPPDELGAAALWYAEHGLRVFPCYGCTEEGRCTCGDQRCEHPGKHPRIKENLAKASTDPEQIREWWRRWPDANIGYAPDSGRVILDVDSLEALEALKHLDFEIPSTAKVETGRGVHLYFVVPEGEQLKPKVDFIPEANIAGKGVDLRAFGSYVVLPPSIHRTGKVYTWEVPLLDPRTGRSQLCEVPEWVIERCSQGRRDTASVTGHEIPEGSRNATLASMAGTLRHRGMSTGAIEAALLIENQQRCIPPLEDKEVHSIAASISRYPTGGSSVSFDSALLARAEVRNLPALRPQAPVLPVELLPEKLREWIADEADRMQCPIEMLAAPAIAGLASLIGRKITVQPKANDSGWVVIPNLWCGVVARPGRLKTPVLREATRGVQECEDLRLEGYHEDECRLRAELLTAEQRVAAIKEDIKKAHKVMSKLDPDQLQESLQDGLSRLDQAKADFTPPRLIVNDCTVEKLHELLAQHSNGLLQIRDELAGWLRSMDREDRRSDRQFWLETWSGDGRYTQDRIGRGTVRAEALCVSVIGGIQPSRFNSFVATTTRGGEGGDGLLQRIQLLVWPEDSPDWKLVDREPDKRAGQRAFALYRQLDTRPPEDHPRRFSPEAQAIFNEWLTDLEKRLRSEELASAPAFESHLAKYRSLMPTLALIFHLASDTPDGEISAEATRRAAAWTEYLEQHARKVYAAELHPGREAAHKLASKVRCGAVIDGMSLREIYRKQWSGLTTADEVDEAITILTECGWVGVESTTLPQGGRPSQILRVNPDVIR